MYLNALLSSILHGLGYPKIPFYINLLGCAIRIVIIWVLIPLYGIRAGLSGMLVSQIVMALLCIFSLRKLA